MNPSDQSESALLNAWINQQDRDAMGELIRRHIQFVHATARRQVGDPHLAEDITQAVFILLLQKAHRLQNEAVMASWLFTTTRFAASNAVRMLQRRKFHEGVALRNAATDYHPAQSSIEQDELQPLLNEAINYLSKTDRTCVIMTFMQCKTRAQVATALGTTEGAVQKRLSRAVERMREFFAAKGITTPAAVIGSAFAASGPPASAELLQSTINVAILAHSAQATGTAAAIAKEVTKMLRTTHIKIAAAVAVTIMVSGLVTAQAVRILNKPPAPISFATPSTPSSPAIPATPSTQSTPPAADPILSPWTRRYEEGEQITYKMKRTTSGHGKAETYEIQANGVVKQDADGNFYEEFAWINPVINGKAIKLSPASQDFRQPLSLPPASPKLSVPDFSKIGTELIVPSTTLLSFYADMRVASQFGAQAKAGDHYHFIYGTPTSWADGFRIIKGEASIDFDCTIKGIDLANQTATLLIRHVPPQQLKIDLPVEWMRTPVVDTPNNWMEVTKNNDGTYTAEVGKETVDNEVKVSLVDGRILSARMDNPIEVLERKCTDAALTHAGKPIRYEIRRQIEIIADNSN